MKTWIVTFFLIQSFILSSYAQETSIKGVVLDSLTNKPVAYVNIGFPGRDLGTVTNIKGEFSLSLPDTYKNELLVFSHLGFALKKVPWNSLITADTVFLQEREDVLAEVMVQAKMEKSKKLGILTHSPFLWGTTHNRKGDIVELAQRIKASDKEIHLRNANIYLRSVYGDSAIVRINFYKALEQGPGERLVHTQLLEQRAVKEGWLTFNLSPHNISLKEDFYISFEFLPIADKPVIVTTGGKMFRGNGYARTSSLGKWKKSGGAYSIYLEVLK